MAGIERIGVGAVPDLLGALRGRNRWERLHAAKVLGHIKDGRAIRPLVEALHDDDAGVRWQAVRALATFGAAALPALCAVLQTEPVTRRMADGAGRVLRRIAHHDMWPIVAPLHEALMHLDAPVEAPVAAYAVRRALLARSKQEGHHNDVD
jgi:HEAT repeat protein